jgi:hypothetical protein
MMSSWAILQCQKLVNCAMAVESSSIARWPLKESLTRNKFLQQLGNRNSEGKLRRPESEECERSQRRDRRLNLSPKGKF